MRRRRCAGRTRSSRRRRTPSANGSRVRVARHERQVRAAPAADLEHAEREVARDRAHAGVRRTARSRCRCPAARSSTRSPGARRRRATTALPPAPVLPEGQHVVGEVVALGDVVEHRRDVARLLVQRCAAGHASDPRHRPYPRGPADVDRHTLASVTRTCPTRGTPHRRPRRWSAAPSRSTTPGPLLGAAARRATRTAPGCAAARAWSAGARPAPDLRSAGPGRFADAERPGAELARHAVVRDEVGLPGTGPVAFGSFAFSAGSTGRRRAGRARARSSATAGGTLVGHRRSAAGAVAARRPSRRVARPRRPPARRQCATPTARGQVRAGCRAVAEAVARITAGELDKVVLARDLDARTERPVDPRWLLGRLGRAATRVLDVQRRRPGRRDAGAARPLRARPGHLAGCWPARSAAPATTTTTSRSPASLARVEQGPRGARVRRALGRRRARAALRRR